MMQGAFAQAFDTVGNAPLLDALQAGGVVTQADRDALTVLATVPRMVTANDVARVVRNDDGSAKPWH